MSLFDSKSDKGSDKLPDSANELKDPGITRREILKKYGAYTAPVVVSMLAPQQAVAMFAGTTYNNIAECYAAHGHSPTFMMNHCPMNHNLLN